MSLHFQKMEQKPSGKKLPLRTGTFNSYYKLVLFSVYHNRLAFFFWWWERELIKKNKQTLQCFKNVNHLVLALKYF